MNERLAGLTAIVTGAARGIGRAVTRRCAVEGAWVYAADVAEEDLHEVVQDLRGDGYRVEACTLDVSNAQAVGELVAKVIDEAGRIDVLVNNAGVIILAPLEDTSPEEWDRILTINLRGPYLLSRSVVPHMKRAGRGSIINVSSRAGAIGFADEAAYCASKFGVEGLSRALARELEPFGICVNSVTPGAPVHTSMSEITYDEDKRKVWLDPAMIAPAFVHLALQTPTGIHDQYVNAWDLSERLRQEGWS